MERRAIPFWVSDISQQVGILAQPAMYGKWWDPPAVVQFCLAKLEAWLVMYDNSYRGCAIVRQVATPPITWIYERSLCEKTESRK